MVMCRTSPLLKNGVLTPRLVLKTNALKFECIFKKRKEFHCLLAPEPVLKTEAKIHSPLFDCAIFSLLRVYHCLFFWLDARKSCIFDLITSLVNS